MKSAKLLFAAAALAVSAGAAQAAIVFQETFDGVIQPFSTAYTFVPYNSGPNTLVPEGVYTIGPDASTMHPSFAAFTNGTGNAMIVNGATGGVPSNVYSTTFTAATAGTYSLSADIASVCCNPTFGGTNAPSVLTISAGNTIVASFATTPGGGGTYPDAGTFFTTSGTASLLAGMYTLSISNGSGAASGNDFAIDNIQVSAVPEPATWAMMLIGFAGLGMAARRRREALAA